MQVIQIKSSSDMLSAFEIRRLVFVQEQQVSAKEEYDEFEADCIHLLALNGANPVGTARIRKTENGTKLERFAVLKEYRGNKVGAALLNFALDQTQGYVYLNAQEQVIPFYAKYGFVAVGSRFYECDIPHFKMEKINATVVI